MKLGEVIKTYRKEHNLSMGQFAEKAGFSKMYLSMLEKNFNPSTGKKIIPSSATFQKCAAAMGLEIDQLLSMLDNDQLVNIIAMPATSIIKTVSRCYNLQEQEMSNINKYNYKTDIIKEPGFSFVLDDESMIFSRIYKGDTIYAIYNCFPINDGDILVVVLPKTDVYTLRRAYKLSNGNLELKADNPTYPILNLSEDDIDSVSFIGKAVKCVFEIK